MTSSSSWKMTALAASLTAATLAAATASPSPDDTTTQSDIFRHYGPFGNGYGPFGSGYNGNGNNGVFGGNGFPGIFSNGLTIQSAIHYRTIHGILASLAIVVLFPVGSILMRVVPGRLAIWVHGIFQVMAFILYIAAAALGIYLVRSINIPFGGGNLLSNGNVNIHPIMGIVTLVTLFFQPILGFIHHARFKQLGYRTFWSYAHIWNGRIGVTVGIVNGGLGLRLANAAWNVKVAYIVVAVIVWFFWFVVAVISEIRRARKGTDSTMQAVAPGGRGYVPPGGRTRGMAGIGRSPGPQMTSAARDASIPPRPPRSGDRSGDHSPKVRDSQSRASSNPSHE